MLNLMVKQPKFTQYLVGGAVAVVILFAWISIPLMQNSSFESSANPNGFFKTKTADVSSLGAEIPAEGGAPGYSLNGGMLNNPATSGENIAATLFQSGPQEEAAPAPDPSADPLAAATPLPGVTAPAAEASAVSPVPASPKAKFSAMSSIAGGNSNSMTAGGTTHDKFFGNGGAVKKEEVLPQETAKNIRRPDLVSDRRGVLVAGLQKMSNKSAAAASSFGADRSREGATSAFESGVKPQTSGLNTTMETASEGAGVSLNAAAQDLKRNDPSISSKKITIPEPKVDKDEEADQEMKKMILQMLMSSLLGGLFSGQ